VWIRPSFKDDVPSPRAKPYRYDSQLFPSLFGRWWRRRCGTCWRPRRSAWCCAWARRWTRARPATPYTRSSASCTRCVISKARGIEACRGEDNRYNARRTRRIHSPYYLQDQLPAFNTCSRGLRGGISMPQVIKAVFDFAGHEAWERLVIAYEPVWAIGTGARPSQSAILVGGSSSAICVQLIPSTCLLVALFMGFFRLASTRLRALPSLRWPLDRAHHAGALPAFQPAPLMMRDASVRPARLTPHARRPAYAQARRRPRRKHRRCTRRCAR
jgi:hypothetical protein